jgi:uncharacterized protein DUF4232
VRRVLGMLCSLVLVLTACGVRPTPVAVTPVPGLLTTPPAPACPDTGVTVTEGLVEAAMGLRVMTLRLDNCGAEPYTVAGYPGVRVLDDHRDELDLQIGDGSFGISTVPAFDAAPTRITVPPGGSATTGLLWRNTVTVGDPAVGSHVLISPTPGAPWQQVASSTPSDEPWLAGEPSVTIDVGTTGRLGVRPWATTP